MAATAQPVEMKKSLTLTGITVNAMALIAPGAFLWTTFQVQAALTQPASSVDRAATCGPACCSRSCWRCSRRTATASWPASTPTPAPARATTSPRRRCSTRKGPHHRKWARVAKLSVGWISHLYYWIYPGIMVAFTGTLFGYIYTTPSPPSAQLRRAGRGRASCSPSWPATSPIRGISGSTMTAIVINVIQITTLVLLTILFIVLPPRPSPRRLRGGQRGRGDHPARTS